MSGRWTVSAGRNIYFDGKPFISVDREGDTQPVEADGSVHFIVDCLNQSNVTPDDIWERHMGHPRRQTQRRATEAQRPNRPRWSDWYRAVSDLARQTGLPPEAYEGPTRQGDEYVHSLFRDGVTPEDAVQWIQDRQARRARAAPPMAHAPQRTTEAPRRRPTRPTRPSR